MRQKDFKFTCYAAGYSIYYKHRLVWHVSLRRGRVGTPGSHDKKKYEALAEAEIRAIINGWGNKIITDKIDKIEADYARLSKRFGRMK